MPNRCYLHAYLQFKKIEVNVNDNLQLVTLFKIPKSFFAV